ncbi:aconitase [Lentinula edodes]|uniref:3-isopropylmalate dehydratase n=1 Tax=Lentinula lateritia TaxID=40482 RepID=A0A9W8ZYZ7_9AGAR|nr:aconitase [Lentinula edodes]
MGYSHLTPKRTLYDKIWMNHIVLSDPQFTKNDNAPELIFVDRHLVHEVSSPQAFNGLWAAKRTVRRPDCTLATADHNVPTTPRTDLLDAHEYIQDVASQAQYLALEKNIRKTGIPYYGLHDIRQGIVHVVGGEQGFVLPGTVCVCGDSHTSTLGAFGALAFGIGTSEVEHVLATQTLRLHKSKNMNINVSGLLGAGVTAKDLILHIIGSIGNAGGTGHVIEYSGEAVRSLNMEERMTLCNMSIEAGARAGLVAPDEVTFTYLSGRPMAPSNSYDADGNNLWEKAMEFWTTLKSDDDAKFDKTIHIYANHVTPTVTWGTSPEDNVPITGCVPDPRTANNPQKRIAMERSLAYMKLMPGTQMEDITINKVFLGSCTNSRITDLRAGAKVLQSLGADARVFPGVEAMVVPGSGIVKRQAEEEGLNILFIRAGFDWREPGCSMCVGLNPDQLANGERCASTSNRNFRDRQGTGGRTHLVSPAMAVAAAVTGKLIDVRKLVNMDNIQHDSVTTIALPSLLAGGPMSTDTLPYANIDESSDEETVTVVRQSRQFISVQGIVAPFQMDNIDTDMLIPASLVKGLTRTGLGHALFNRLRFDPVSGIKTTFVLNQTPYNESKILACSGENFGCGSSREHAVWALKDFGISCVIAPSYGDIFSQNCLQNGVLLVTLPQDTCQILVDYASTGHEINVDLIQCKITCIDTGTTLLFKVDAAHRQQLLGGVDSIDITLQNADKIEEYEAQRKVKWSWLELGEKNRVGARKVIGYDLDW